VWLTKEGVRGGVPLKTMDLVSSITSPGLVHGLPGTPVLRGSPQCIHARGRSSPSVVVLPPESAEGGINQEETGRC